MRFTDVELEVIVGIYNGIQVYDEEANGEVSIKLLDLIQDCLNKNFDTDILSLTVKDDAKF